MMEHAPTSAFGRAALAYGRVGLTSGVDAADPHRLVLMLFEGALEAIAQARAHHRAGDPAARARAAAKAALIVEQGLHASLDRRVGGPLAATLAGLCDFVGRRVRRASAAGDDAGLAEAARLLAELREAWSRVDPGQR